MLSASVGARFEERVSLCLPYTDVLTMEPDLSGYYNIRLV